MSASFDQPRIDAERRAAPFVRAAAMALYDWRRPGTVGALALLAAAPLIAACVLAPTLLSLQPVAEIIAPIAEARALGSGGARLAEAPSPFYAFLILLADLVGGAPGRTHLITKALAGLSIALPAAYVLAARFPTIVAILLTAAIAAFAAAPFSATGDFALALLLLLCLQLLCVPGEDSTLRQRIEGIVAGAVLLALWLTSPVVALAGAVVLFAAPFVGGAAGFARYVVAAAAFGLSISGFEALAGGFNISRWDLAVAAIGEARNPAQGAFAFGGLVASAVIVTFISGSFGGRAHWRSWSVALVVMAVSFLAAATTGANPTPGLAIAAAVAVFSTASPFYDGVFRRDDRASVSLSISAGALALFAVSASLSQQAGQFVLQHRAAGEGSADIRAELALVQPGGEALSRWVEEGRLSTPRTRELLALAPIEQTETLLKAAARAREFSRQGVDVAILTSGDAACVLAEARACRADGAKAAGEAAVVLVPRADLDPATAEAKSRAQVLLYTDFKLAEETPLFDIWVRRGARLPAGVVLNTAR